MNTYYTVKHKPSGVYFTESETGLILFNINQKSGDWFNSKPEALSFREKVINSNSKYKNYSKEFVLEKINKGIL